MYRRLTVPLLFMMVGSLTVIPVGAQEGPAGSIAQVVVVQPHPGHHTAFEQGMARHTQTMSEEAGGTWTWVTFEIVMGERTGQYVVGTYNHAWADFDAQDADPEMARESMQDNITPHVESWTSRMMERVTDISMWDPNEPLAPMYEVITFDVALGGAARFEHFMMRLKQAMEAEGVEGRYSVFRSRLGGTGNQWVVSVPHDDMASFGGGEDDWLERLLVGAFTHAGGQMLMEDFNSLVTGVTSELFVLRRDMSGNLPEM
jgi:hypothetical protein